MATKTDESVTGQKYTRQRSNSDPQPNLEESKDTLSVKGTDDPGDSDSDGEKQKNGEVKTASLGPNTPQPEKRSKFSSFGKIFKPWKWKRKKKSEKIEKTAVELERKISVRSTREELIKKGVLKEPLDIKPSTQEGPSIEQTSAEIDNDQNKTSTVEVEQNHVDQNSTDTDKAEGTEKINPGENVDSVVTTELSQCTTITTQAEITPVSSSADTPALTTAQARPMVFPKLPNADKPEPAPKEVTMETAIPTKEESSTTKEDTSVSDKPSGVEVTKNNEQQVNKPEQKNEKQGEEEEPEIIYPEGYAPVPASEPDLSLIPKKSALKGAGGGGGDSKPVTPVSQDKNDNHSHVNFSHVDVITTPQISNVIKQPSPKPSPKSTPLSSAMARPKLRGGLAHFSTDSNKENVPIPVSMPTVPPTTTSSHSNDDSSSDDEEIRYRDEEEEEDEEQELSSLAAKVARQDSLAKFLSSRPTRRELVEKNIIHSVSEDQDKERRSAIGTALTRRLSLRPSQEELEQRNILHMQSSEEARKEKEEKKKFLIRKLSFRPSIEELKERKIIQFSDYVEWTEAHEYDRRADKPWTRLTPKDKAAIRKELNEFKSKEMDVHEESKHLTRFHRP
ncbi:Phosphatase and actin regulator 3,Phosphatase and actin regulator 4A,Phosphatase and actin regulator 1,Phosphatase and actin regulator 4B,Phosphatase and actin regulator 4-B,Phosphatase and actin regulator 2,Phosphatase and actin regulator 4 [Mytilus coruscus]|uniref:Phosphatase and actin regulator n=1 Tax=Mytilus coruscus TaxID=42192 RepID=A0A6J8AF07_MYTCO|nr:Phosphatase and actin regulator 3,Phosphatase and actin regulator 4A,Phosphatase and actin regulator 1,Phosphatase and actin regulator 4B,Phosphatase and actin regulator 4-B,Phosphatase and actin regulator 2,Phosphatase and actin regulator 4 [Mytilus coruscus]